MANKYDELVKALRAMPVNPTMLLFVEGAIAKAEAASLEPLPTLVTEIIHDDPPKAKAKGKAKKEPAPATKPEPEED